MFEAQEAKHVHNIAQLTKRWQRTHRLTAAARRVLVNEITTLFEFKPGVVVVAEPLQPLSRQPVAELVDSSTYSKEELNAAIGHVIHILGLIVHYLGVKLPFVFFHKGISPYIRSASIRSRQQSRMPLFLDNKNLKRFTIGMAMLNYDIGYLCHTQGVDIPLHQIPNTLQGLMACCQSSGLGV
ncbi:UV radiation resistance protein/autophagy-related protein 14 [Phycomyces blakesleeanus]|uniref:Autophagy-related protein 14 n=1 Tax=Phycomyces blakesleeanus TaxID=4837 RepID=A0ABR3BDS4_PHYBL